MSNGDGTYSSGDPSVFSVSLGSNPDTATIIALTNQYLQYSIGATSSQGAWFDASASGYATNRGQSLWIPLGTTDFSPTSVPPKKTPDTTNTCPCNGPLGDAVGAGSESGGNTSPAKVDYVDGSITLVRSDLSSGGFGTPWGQAATWTNTPGYSDGDSGSGFTQTQAPHLVQVDGDTSIALVTNSSTAHFFTLVSGSYQAGFYDTATLTHDTMSGTFVVQDGTGQTFTFADFSSSTPTGQGGNLTNMTDAAGNTTEVVSWNADGQPTEVQRTSGSGSTAITESFLSTYVSLGVNAGLLETVTQRTKIGTGSWTTTRSTAYSYYDGTSGPGQAGDLKLAEVKDTSGNVIDTNYYRYYTSGAGSVGKMHFTFGTQAYGLLTEALGTDLDSLTDTQVAPYADTALTFDSSGRVATVVDAGAGCSVCSGGQGTFNYTYTSNPSLPAPGENIWAMKTVETLPDGSTNTVYTNGFGQVMLKAFQDVSGTDTWITYSEFNASGQTILVANPSAVTGYDDSYDDLVHFVSDNAQYLSDSDGLIMTYAYPTATTATTTTPGDVVGYLKETDIQHGETGTPIPQESMDYIANTASGATVYKVASDTVYRNDDGTGAETTSYDYTYFSGTNQIQSATTTLPVISTAQNGSGTADSVTTVMDQFGRPIWTKDQAGYLTYTAYDDATGAIVKTITDVDTTQTSEFANLPSGWTTPTGGGRNLITTYEVDSLGRVTKETTPEGRVSFTVYNDAAHEVRMYSGWDSSTNLPTGPTTVSRQDLANGYTETLTMSATPTVSGGVPTGTEAISNVQSLSRSYTNDAGQVVYSDSYFNLGGLTYSTAANIGTEGVNFYRTRFQYDDKGNLTRTVSPQGTISRTVYDGQSRPVSQWVGTDDTPTSGYWSPSNLTGTNMVKVADYEYDNGGVGDGNLTKTTAHPGESAADRVTQSWFDWRNRTVAVKSGVESSESSDVHRPLMYANYDNLGEVVETRMYDADGVTPSIVDGVPQPLSSSLLRADSTTSYDDLGRVYRTDTYSVDPTTGAVSTNSLHTDMWYDSRGNVIKTVSPGGSVDKEVYDGAGFNTVSYMTDGGGDSTYADASNVTGDIVLEQADRTFDKDGDVIETATRQRFHDATGTGVLGTPTSGVPARVSYVGYYFDLGNRLTDAVDVGTNGGTAWTRPSSVPSRSDTVLVTSESYAADALQTVKLAGSPTGGTFTLTFDGQTTSGIAYNATASTVETALEALSSVGSGNVVVSPAVNGGWEVRFSGSLGGLFQNQMTADGLGLTGGTSPSVAVATISLGGDAGNVVDTTDPKGLVHRTYSDPLGRDVQDIENFTDGIVTDNSNVTTDYTYNSVGQTSLTAEQADGTGQTTAWVYGVSPATGSTITSNDIVGVTQYPDPTTGLPSSSSSEEESSTADALGETTTTTDRNGNVHTLSYDVLGRVVSDAVTTLGAGVDGSVRRIDTAYDSQGNAYLITSYDAVTGGSIVNQVEDVYNGLGQLTAEYQQNGGAVNTSTSPVVLYSYSEMAGGMNASRLTSMTYPSGYVLNYNYASGLDDSISRLSSISDSTGILESYAYLGLGTVVERNHPQPGLNLSYVSSTSSTGDAGDQYTGLDRFGRVAEQLWTNAASTAVSDFLYGYDRNSNRVYRDDGVNSAFGELYTYDGLNQLSSFQRGTLNSSKDGLTGTASASQNWNYDALGNWNSVTTDGSTQTRTANAQNEITSISGATTPTYDSNGNMTGDETGRTFVYDAWNRLVAVKSGSTVLETFGYDGLNRRVAQAVSGVTTNLVYSAQDQVLEEQVGGETTMRYVWSPVYVNAMILRDRATTTPGTLDERLWVMQDANWNVVGLGDGSSNVVERYTYTPFGVQTVYDASYNVRSSGSAYAFGYGFQSMRFDAVSGLNESESRLYSPTLGRFTSVDPISFAGGINLYEFVGNGPANRVDPSGLKPGEENYNLLDGLLLYAAFDCFGEGDMYKNILKKRDDFMRIVRAKVIPEAVIKALRDLKMPQDQIDKLTIGLGNNKGKSPLSAKDVKTISDFLGDKLSTSTTTSGDSASAVKLNDNWELKIYKNKDEYSISVVTQAGSFEHIGDALNYYIGYPINVHNAADFLGGPVYTKEALDLLNTILKDCKCEQHRDKLIKGRDKIQKEGIEIDKPLPFAGFVPPKGNPAAPYPPSK